MTTTWLSQSLEERREILADLAPKMGISLANVEKDFWLTFTLDKIFSFPHARETFVFGGGSSLSKSYGLIDRFSEDIDLAITHQALGFGENLSRHQISHQMGKDYQLMSQVMIYDEKTPHFKNLLEELTHIQEEIRKIKIL